MKPSTSKSVALRLLGWLLVLIVLPLIIMAFFSRQDTANEFQRSLLRDAQQQAERNAAAINGVLQSITPTDFIAASQPHNGIHFLIGPSGVYLAHPNPHRIGQKMQNDYSLETINKISQGGSGSIFDIKTNQNIGYAYEPGKNWIDIVAIETPATNSALDHLQQTALIQLILSLVFVLIATIAIIWHGIGHLSNQPAKISAETVPDPLTPSPEAEL